MGRGREEAEETAVRDAFREALPREGREDTTEECRVQEEGVPTRGRTGWRHQFGVWRHQTPHLACRATVGLHWAFMLLSLVPGHKPTAGICLLGLRGKQLSLLGRILQFLSIFK